MRQKETRRLTRPTTTTNCNESCKTDRRRRFVLVTPIITTRIRNRCCCCCCCFCRQKAGRSKNFWKDSTGFAFSSRAATGGCRRVGVSRQKVNCKLTVWFGLFVCLFCVCVCVREKCRTRCVGACGRWASSAASRAACWPASTTRCRWRRGRWASWCRSWTRSRSTAVRWPTSTARPSTDWPDCASCASSRGRTAPTGRRPAPR